jgi:hypothetical protein
VARLDDAAPFLPHRPARRPPNGPDPPTCPRLCMCRRERLCLRLRLCLHLCLHLRLCLHLCLHLRLCLHRRAQCPAGAADGHGAAWSGRPPWASMPWSVLFQAAQAPLFHSRSPYVGISLFLSLSLSLCVCVCVPLCGQIPPVAAEEPAPGAGVPRAADEATLASYALWAQQLLATVEEHWDALPPAARRQQTALAARTGADAPPLPGVA